MAKLQVLSPVPEKKLEKSGSEESEKKAIAKTPQPVVLKLPPPTFIVKQKEFDAFTAWLAIPPLFKRPPVDKKTRQRPEVRDFLEAIGVNDDKLIELAEITTQQMFAEKYAVSMDTLTDWKKKIFEKDLLGELADWARPLMGNVLMAHYNQCIRGGLPEHYKLFYQIVGGWSEKMSLNISKREIKTVNVHVIHSNKHD